MVGFWNLVSGFLSHDAVLELQAMGTFYHLFPENPNAAEWFAWWLEALAITDHLQCVRGGMELLIRKMHDELRCDENVSIITGFEVMRLEEREAGCVVYGRLADTDVEGYLLSTKGGEATTDHMLRVVPGAPRTQGRKNAGKLLEFNCAFLALPKEPLVRLVRSSQEHSGFLTSSDYGDVLEALESAFAFPLIKVFCLVRRKWWDDRVRANTGATRVPTRELYAWSSDIPNSRSQEGLLMLYTDRPATSFWANYVRSDIPHTDFHAVTIDGVPTHDLDSKDRALEEDLALWTRLRQKICRYVNEAEKDANLQEDDILWVGIRDWGRWPFGGANHAWRPKRRYWSAMRRLSAFASRNSKAKLHVCGEAYSDYHGFIEGALRSSVLATAAAFQDLFVGDQSGFLQTALNYAAAARKVSDEREPDETSPDGRYLKHLAWWISDLRDLTDREQEPRPFHEALYILRREEYDAFKSRGSR